MTTSKQVGNPTGKGGFQERPQDRNSGHWNPKMTFSFQYRRFMEMPVIELEKWLSNSKDSMTVVEHLAYKRVLVAKKSLQDVREITDRTEGKAPQTIDHTSGGEKIQTNILEIINGVYGSRSEDDSEGA